MKKYWKYICLCVVFLLPFFLSAHEVYVLSKATITSDYNKPVNPFLALANPANIGTTAIIVASILVVLLLNFLFQHSRIGQRLGRKWQYLSRYESLIPRIAASASFFISAYTWSFLGPELPLTNFPAATIIRLILFLVSMLIFLGLFTEVAAILAFIVFTMAFLIFHTYMFTYTSYIGELVVLFLFGSRPLSLDYLFFGPRSILPSLEKYEDLVIRVAYGFSLFYTAINIKFLHAALTLDVVNDYNLTRFHWLFPSDPLLVVLGAGLAEIVIALFIIFGFELRLTVLISLFYITLSLIFFKELVWPHFILYGVSLHLLFAPPKYSLDSYFDRLFSKE